MCSQERRASIVAAAAAFAESFALSAVEASS
jgi:hypothetical protein